MKIIDLEQGSIEWLSWRKTVITATDCPALLGSSPWSTAYKCWQRKLGLLEEQKSNVYMERGKRLEPISRERFIKKYAINMTPLVVESSEYEFLGASLDGLSDCGKYILEIKTGGMNLDVMASQGTIPEYYMHQMQHQMLVTCAEKCFYYVGHEDEDKDMVIEVLPDPKFKEKFIPIALDFWKKVSYSESPSMQRSDYKDMSSEQEWNTWATEYRKVSEEIKVLTEDKEYYRQLLLNKCGEDNCVGAGIRVVKTIPKGRVAYDEIPELKNVDLDKYRKKSTVTWTISLE